MLTACGNKEVPNGSNSNDNINTDDKKANNESKDNKGGNANDKSNEVAGYAFEYNNIVIPMHAEAAPIVEALGEPMEYFEAPSCAFQGLDKTYYYNGFEIVTYPMDGVDYISNVTLMDDSVATKENIYIGSSIDDVIAAYGDDYEKQEGFYTYTLEDTYIQFITEDDVVTNIAYFAITD